MSYGGRCPACGKLCFPDRRTARRAGRRMSGWRGSRPRAYQCGTWWHLTSASAESVAYHRRSA